LTDPQRKQALDKYRQTEAYRLKQMRYLTSDRGQAYLAAKRKRHRTKRLQKENEGKLSAYELRAIAHAYRQCCAYCGKKTDPKLPDKHPDKQTLDHVVPLSKGGLHQRENVVIACWFCNDRKGDDLWTPNPPVSRLRF